MAASDAPPQRTALADEVGLPDELLEVARAHARGERLALRRGLEEGLGSGALGSAGGGHGPMVAPAAASADQNLVNPVISATAYRPNRKATSEPPTSAMRRTSRTT